MFVPPPCTAQESRACKGSQSGRRGHELYVELLRRPVFVCLRRAASKNYTLVFALSGAIRAAGAQCHDGPRQTASDRPWRRQRAVRGAEPRGVPQHRSQPAPATRAQQQVPCLALTLAPFLMRTPARRTGRFEGGDSHPRTPPNVL